MFEALIKAGLVKQKRYENGLSVFKYARKVFYDALWNTDPLLLEARGIVIDDAGNKVIWPFTKVFNYKENNAGVNLMMDTPIIAPRKVNGFMAACRYWNGELIVSTTGSLDSDFAVLARSYIEKLNGIERDSTNMTLLFEICDPSDPHIVEEEAGAYLIGARLMQGCDHEGEMLNEAQLHGYAESLGAKRPEVFRGTFGQLWHMVRECRHEGWMVILAETGETVMKIKSPHYLSKKFLMRMSDKKVDNMFDCKEEFMKTLDEEFYAIVSYITRWWDKEKWKNTSEADRRAVIEKYFEKEAQ
jgi:hypothetical protein